jgi:hypothetical protein
MITSPTRVHCELPPVGERNTFAESKGLEETWSVWRIVPEVVRRTGGAQTTPQAPRLRARVRWTAFQQGHCTTLCLHDRNHRF